MNSTSTVAKPSIELDVTFFTPLMPDDWTGYPLRRDYPVQVRKDAAAWSPLELTAEEFAANVRASRAASADLAKSKNRAGEA